jgi:hypothetical protein
MKVRTLKRRTMMRMERDHRVRLLRQLGASARCFSAAAYAMSMHMREVAKAAAVIRSTLVESTFAPWSRSQSPAAPADLATRQTAATSRSSI